MSGSWAAGWATSDIVSAAEFAKGIGCIYDTTLSGGAASIDVTSIPAVYAHLLLVGYLRSDTAAYITGLLLRFNNDSGSNYDCAATGQTSINPASTSVGIAGASRTSSVFAPVAILIPHYAGSSNDKSALFLASLPDNASNAWGAGTTPAGVWKATAAINRITLSPAAGSLIAGSRFSIYAMGA